MLVAINLLALLLVVGMCWLAMVWLTGRFHPTDREEVHMVAIPVDPDEVEPGAPCVACEGIGATRAAGRLSPCAVCEGTGVWS